MVRLFAEGAIACCIRPRAWLSCARADEPRELRMRSVTLNRRVLVVDDDRAIHEVFRRLLGRGDASAAPGALPSFALSFAAQGAEGLEMIAQGVAAGAPFALVILDVRMPPGWDGLDTLE